MSTFDYSDFWNEAYRLLHEEFAAAQKEQEFLLWFNIEYVSSVQGIITLSVPSAFIRDQLQRKNYISMIENKLFEVLGQPIKTNFIVKPVQMPPQQNFFQQQNFQKQNNQINSLNPSSPSQINGNFSQNRNAQANNFQQNNYQQPSNRFQQFQNNVSTGFQQETKDFQTISKPKHPTLNEKYTFDKFVTGENNAFAYNAAISVSNNPGKAYNPLLILGNVGLGKTHLMEAIGNAIYDSIGGKIIYITAENFTNEFIESINTKSQQKFKNKYRSADVLLIDDIHFLQNKEGTQDELFSTYEALYGANKQLVFTCDRPLSELKNLTDRLRSRFGRGLTVDLNLPDYETRCAILVKKLQEQNQTLPKDVIELIAKNIASNVRDLEACLTKVVAYIELTGQKATVESVQHLLRDSFNSSKKENISIEIIQKVVAEAYGISWIDLKGKKRTKNIVLPRQLAMYIAKEMTEYSTTELGSEFGGRDHTTVMHSIDKIKDAIKTDSSLDLHIQSLKRKIEEYQK